VKQNIVGGSNRHSLTPTLVGGSGSLSDKDW